MEWTIGSGDIVVTVNSSPPAQKGRRLADDVFRCIFVNEKNCNFVHEKIWISIWISLKFVPNGPIDNNPRLVYIMALRQIGEKPL